MIVEYSKKGDAVSDFDVNEFVEHIISTEDLFPTCHVSTSNVIDTFRLYYKEGKIKTLNFMFNGEIIDVDSNGKLSRWPKGFCDINMIQLSQLARS